MSDVREEGGSPAPSTAIISCGLAASIPAAIIATAIRSRGRHLGDTAAEVTVNATDLAVHVSPEALTEILAATFPGRTISVDFADAVIRVRLDDLPAVRLELPPSGLWLRARPDGLRLGDDRADR